MGVYDIKQYIIINGNLKMTKGKIAAQSAHASMKVFFDRMIYYGVSDEYPTDSLYFCKFTEDMVKWKDGAFAKIVLKAHSEMYMNSLYKAACDLNIPCAEIIDNGVTQVEAGSLTAVAIGPLDVNNPKYISLINNLKDLPLL